MAAASTPSVRVLLVDDHELIRAGLSAAFAAAGAAVVGQAGTVAEAFAAFADTTPDTVVTDLQLPDGTGLDIVRTLRRQAPQVGLVVLTMHAGDDQIFAAMEAGASAFVGKDAPSTDVVSAALRAATAPRTFVCRGLTEAMMRRAGAETTRLSERESEVLRQLAEGLGSAAIARALFMSESTVKSHIARIYDKLGAANRAQALVTAMRNGLLSSIAPGRGPAGDRPLD